MLNKKNLSYVLCCILLSTTLQAGKKSKGRGRCNIRRVFTTLGTAALFFAAKLQGAMADPADHGLEVVKASGFDFTPEMFPDLSEAAKELGLAATEEDLMTPEEYSAYWEASDLATTTEVENLLAEAEDRGEDPPELPRTGTIFTKVLQVEATEDGSNTTARIASIPVEEEGRRLNIFGEDERVSPEAGDINVRSGGIVQWTEDGSTYQCTVAKRSDHIYSTNAHCGIREVTDDSGRVIRREITPEMLENMRIYPALHDNQVVFGSVRPVKGVIFERAYLDSSLSFSKDWMALVTDAPLSSSAYPSRPIHRMSPSDYLPDTVVNLIGYSGDRFSRTPGEHRGCKIRRVLYTAYGPLIIHDCDATRGSSGSDIDIRPRDIAEAVALNNGFFYGGAPDETYPDFALSRANTAVATDALYDALRERAYLDFPEVPEDDSEEGTMTASPSTTPFPSPSPFPTEDSESGGQFYTAPVFIASVSGGVAVVTAVIIYRWCRNRTTEPGVDAGAGKGTARDDAV